MNYTKEEYDYLSQFKSHFDTAINSHFVRVNNRNTLSQMDAIYTRVFGRSSNILGGCARCVCDAMAKLGQKWYEDKNAYVELEAKNKPIDLIDENCGTTVTKTAKKPSAAKKTAKKTTNKKK